MFKFFKKNQSEKKSKKEDPKSFFELSSAEQKKIIERATVKANQEQQELVRSCN